MRVDRVIKYEYREITIEAKTRNTEAAVIVLPSLNASEKKTNTRAATNAIKTIRLSELLYICTNTVKGNMPVRQISVFSIVNFFI